MRLRPVILFGVLLVMVGSAWSSQPVFDNRGRQVATDGVVWEQADEGALPVGVSKGGYTDPESGLILRWLTHNDALPGLFNDDLIGEDSIIPVCDGQPLGSGDDAPYVYWYEGWTDNFATGQWQAPFDNDTCTETNEDLVKYFFTQVRSDDDIESLLSLGHDDSLKVWVNGAQVYEGVEGVWEADGHQVPVDLVSGWNSILVKMYFPELTEDAGYRHFSLRFLEEGGGAPLILTQSIDGWCGKDGGRNWVYAGGVADLPGAHGSVWSSDLRVTNILPYKMLVTIEYFEEGRARPAKVEGPDNSVDIVFEPYESRTWERVLRTLFGMDESQKGMLAIRGFDDYDCERGAVSMRTYNRSGAGTFGMNIPFGDLYKGSTCCSQVLLGLSNGPGFRSNLAGTPMAVTDSETTITVMVWDMASGRTASGDFSVEGYFQINDIFDAVGLGDVETSDAAVEVSWTNMGDGARWLFTASVNDNVTSDPTFFNEGPWLRFPDD
ncbi:MAG: hypothetical protein ABFS37_03865 [Acidobacteriota bacterium]